MVRNLPAYHNFKGLLFWSAHFDNVHIFLHNLSDKMYNKK